MPVLYCRRRDSVKPALLYIRLAMEYDVRYCFNIDVDGEVLVRPQFAEIAAWKTKQTPVHIRRRRNRADREFLQTKKEVLMFDFPVVTLSWFGIMSIVILMVFCSLAYEINEAMNACHKANNDEAWHIVRATLHFNGMAMSAAIIAAGASCVMIEIDNDMWRTMFAIGILSSGAFISYARASESKLKKFVQVHVLPPARHA